MREKHHRSSSGSNQKKKASNLEVFCAVRKVLHEVCNDLVQSFCSLSYCIILKAAPFFFNGQLLKVGNVVEIGHKSNRIRHEMQSTGLDHSHVTHRVTYENNASLHSRLQLYRMLQTQKEFDYIW